MTAAPLVILTPPPQTDLHLSITLLILGFLVFILFAANLFSKLQNSTSTLAQQMTPADEFSSQLASLVEAPASLDILTGRLQEFLTTKFQCTTIQLRQIAGHQLHDLIHVIDGQPKPLATERLEAKNLPVELEKLEQWTFITWQDPDDRFQRSKVILPLKFEQDLIGYLILGGKSTTHFESSAIKALQQIASLTAAALQLHALNSELEDRATQLVLLGEISRRLISLRPLGERWLEIVPLLSQTFGFAHVKIFEIDGGTPYLMANSHPAPDENGTRLSKNNQELVNQVASGRETIQSYSDQGTSVSCLLAVPMLVQDHLLGVLLLEQTEWPGFSQEERGLAEMIAAQMGIASLEAQNYAQQQEYTWYNTVMLEITRHASQPGDPSAAIRAVLQLTTMLAGANWTFLLLPDEVSQTLRVGPSSGLSRQVEDQLEQATIKRQEFGLQPPFSESDRPYQQELPSYLSELLGQKHCLAMILSDGQSLLGLLLIGAREPSNPKRELLTGIGHQLSMRIENTLLIEDLATQRSLERELETARNIQQDFLPKSLPSPAEWEVGSIWRAARQVGGDFYDFIPLPSGDNGPRWGVSIADVADKGVPAALFMALCRTLLRSIADQFPDPSQALTRLNQLLLSDTHTDLFVSLFYLIWEPSTGRILYANGGHNPPLHFSPGEAPKQLRGSGMVLGVSEKARYETYEYNLDSADILVMYTDGVTEAMNSDGVFFGREALINAIDKCQGRSAQTMAEEVSRLVVDFAATPEQSDDLTIVILKRL